MKILSKMKFLVLLLIILIQFFFISPLQKAYAATSPNLGTAASYSILAGSAVTNTGSTTISGNVGISPGTVPPNYTGFGSITLGGTIHDADGAALTAMSDKNTAYTALASQGCDIDYGGVTTDLAGKNLVPGVYCSNSFHLTGTLTLNGAVSDVWIFKSASDLIMTGGSAVKVVFTGGGQPCNVWWRVVSTATFDANSTLVGNILADTSITFAAGASLNGRALARTAEVTLSSNSITGPTCESASSSTSSSGGSASAPAAKVCPVLNCVTPIVIESKRVDANSIFISWGPYAGINTFIVQYGLENGKWLYNTKVTGFSTTIHALPSNQPIWVLIAPTDDCSIGPCGVAKLVGGPSLPNTGLGPYQNNMSWYTFPFYLPNGLYEKQVEQRQTQSMHYSDPMKQILGIEAQKESPGFPVRLTIPAINVNANIQNISVTQAGEMDVPSNAVDVGWFKLGSRPGEMGSAVIAGHFDGKNGEAGVFTNLYKLKEGDKLYIEDDIGATTSFVVRESRTYDPGYAEEVFSLNDSVHLNLITCDGVWDGANKSYSKRLVVFADIIH